MQSFWIAILLFALLLTCVIVNAIYIQKTADTLSEAIQSLDRSEEQKSALDLLERLWEKHRKRIGLTVGFRELDHFGELLTQLRWAFDTQNTREFARYRALLSDAVEEISRTDTLSLSSIF